jgi:radical SAM superfamily enzyme YgiQ (UPF0313 family)
LENTLQFLVKLDPDSVAINFATPYPGTELFRESQEKGWIKERDWSHFSSFDVVLNANCLKGGDLQGMARKIFRHTLVQRINKLLSEPLMGDLSARCRLLAEYYVPKLAKESLGL